VTNGFECDATPFSSDDTNTPDKLAEILESTGFRGYGTETLYNGGTGTRMKVKIFIGPTYYQRLKHMSKDKLHARGTGPLQLLTRQPPEGRKRDGGFRFGEINFLSLSLGNKLASLYEPGETSKLRESVEVIYYQLYIEIFRGLMLTTLGMVKRYILCHNPHLKTK
jgi:hypothetical protein